MLGGISFFGPVGFIAGPVVLGLCLHFLSCIQSSSKISLFRNDKGGCTTKGREFATFVRQSEDISYVLTHFNNTNERGLTLTEVVKIEAVWEQWFTRIKNLSILQIFYGSLKARSFYILVIASIVVFFFG